MRRPSGRQAVTLLLLAAACEPSDKQQKPRRDMQVMSDARPSAEVQGTLAVDGQPLVVTTCRAGRGVTTYVELVTPLGKLRFEDKQLFWATEGNKRGERLECAKLDRSWGGGLRPDGTSYFRGTLIFVCRGPIGALKGDLVVDCGAITAEERKQLDANRTQLRDEQAQASGDRCNEVDKRERALFADHHVAYVTCREDRWPPAAQTCMIDAVDVAAWQACQTPEIRAGLARRGGR